MQMWKRMVLAAGVGLLLNTQRNMESYAAVHMVSTEAENEITTGDVAIALCEYELDESGKEQMYQDGKRVLPGQRVSKIVRVINEAQPVWVRLLVTYETSAFDEGCGDEILNGIDECWKKIGRYYYYIEPLQEDAQADFFREIQIPSEWDSRISEQEFGVTVTAQAIQADHFQPDFSSEDPWFGIPIEKCVHTEHQHKQETGDSRFEIVFENGAEGFVKDSSDFFEDFSAMVPGDSRTGTLEFGSHFGRDLSISFRSEVPEEQDEAALKLLQDLELTIQSEHGILYEGSLLAEPLAREITLIEKLRRDDTKIITYSLYMPESLQNASALQSAKVRWIFTADYESSGGGGSSGSGGSGSKNEKPVPEVSVVSSVEQAVEQFAEYLEALPGTGDDRNGTLFLVMLFSGSAAFFLSSGEKPKNRKGEKEQHEEQD